MNEPLRARVRHAASWNLLRSATWGERLLWATIVVLPFQQAFTFDLGFPLKLVEILGGISILFFLYERRVDLAQWKGAVWRRADAKLVLLLALLLITSSAIAFFAPHPKVDNDAYPRGINVDLLLYTTYAGFALLLYVAFSVARNWMLLVRALQASACLAFAYCCTQFILWQIDLDLLSAFNGTIQVGQLYGVPLPRNGPFLEGNYFGLYLAVSLFIFLRHRSVLSIFLTGAMLGYSQSTTAVLAVFAGAILMVLMRPSRKSITVLGATTIIGVLVAIFVPIANRFALAQLTKLGLIENTLGPSYGYSLRTRSASAETAFSMAWDYPVFGVGQGRFAAHYWDYLDLTGLPGNFGQNAIRPIVNNVYAQIAAETGFAALGVLCCLILVNLVKARGDGRALVGGVVAMAVGLVAYPAWTNPMPWILLGIIASLFGKPQAIVLPERSRSGR